jgi:hypothetical protein
MARTVFASWWNQLSLRALRGGGMGRPVFLSQMWKPRGRPRVGANAGLHRPSIFCTADVTRGLPANVTWPCVASSAVTLRGSRRRRRNGKGRLGSCG